MRRGGLDLGRVVGVLEGEEEVVVGVVGVEFAREVGRDVG